MRKDLCIIGEYKWRNSDILEYWLAYEEEGIINYKSVRENDEVCNNLRFFTVYDKEIKNGIIAFLGDFCVYKINPYEIRLRRLKNGEIR